MTTTPLLRACLLLGALSAIPSTSAADVINLHFTGKVDDIFDATTKVGLVAHVGDSVVIDIQYDDLNGGLFDFYPDDPAGGGYFAPGFMRIQIKQSVFEFGVQVGLVVSDGNTGAGFNAGGEYFEAYAPVFGPGAIPTVWPEKLPVFAFTSMNALFVQTTPPFDLVTTDAPPPSIDIRGLAIAEGSISASNGDENEYSIHFKIPEPGTISLFGLGLAWSVRRVRRRQQNVQH